MLIELVMKFNETYSANWKLEQNQNEDSKLFGHYAIAVYDEIDNVFYNLTSWLSEEQMEKWLQGAHTGANHLKWNGYSK